MLINLIRNNEIYMRIKLICKLLLDQLDPHDLSYTRTHLTLRTSYAMPTTTVTPITNTFTFTAPNKTNRKKMNKQGSTDRREKRKRQCARKHIVPFKTVEQSTIHGNTIHGKERKQEGAAGVLWVFLKVAGCTNNNVGCN